MTARLIVEGVIGSVHEARDYLVALGVQVYLGKTPMARLVGARRRPSGQSREPQRGTKAAGRTALAASITRYRKLVFWASGA